MVPDVDSGERPMSFLSIVSKKLKALTTASRSGGAPRPSPIRLTAEAQAEISRVHLSDIDEMVSAIRYRIPVTVVHGRAGTGKTTLVRELIKQTKLNYVVVAPTGVAALNAGGQTIHSFFRLRPGMINLDEIEPINRLGNICVGL
jgi:hypothetical protein